MNNLKTILLTLAAIAAGTPATRADELSDLVAAVAASVDTVRIAKDVKATRFDTRPRYQANASSFEIDASLLDDIFRSMKRQSARRLQKREEYRLYDDWEQDFYRPTLGRSDFYRPVKGIMTSRFGWRPQFHRMHHGVDLALQIGDTVKAAVSGTVEKIAYDHTGYGHYVVVSHPDGMETVYGHLQYALVAQGQFIYSGQPLGIGGNTGNSTGPHLHFETRLGGVAVDPTLIFDFYGIGRYINEEVQTTTQAPPKTPIYTHQSRSLKNESTYIVRVGDTPESIARQAGISVIRLRQLNMLNENETLPIGRMLKLR
ncbi:MAG: peptidoglycan DD-metalloendopeptidase family protein [Muribaculaceae bacterium]|nr:peptidoglycan DD-metalloendopeptidase family protein [Muribaculaceae bacterium]